MRRWKTNQVRGIVVSRAKRSGVLPLEALESRTLLSGHAFLLPSTSENAVPVSQIELSGAFAKFNSSAKAGKKFTETITVSNTGNAPASGVLPIVVSTSPDQSLADAAALTTIDKKVDIKPGKPAKISLSLTAPAEAGSFHLIIQLDPNNTLGNDILTNNTFASSGALNVKAAPFKTGPIAGQNGWQEFDSVSSPASTAVVSTKITPPAREQANHRHQPRGRGEYWRGAGSRNHLRRAVYGDRPGPGELQTTANGPFFGLNLFGNNGAVEIGSFGVDATSGKVS